MAQEKWTLEQALKERKELEQKILAMVQDYGMKSNLVIKEIGVIGLTSATGFDVIDISVNVSLP